MDTLVIAGYHFCPEGRAHEYYFARPVLTHGVGTRTDLPVPTWLAAMSAALVVLISFIALGFHWRQPSTRKTYTLPPVFRLLDHPALRWGLRALSLAMASVVVLVGLLGPDDSSRNLLPWLFFVQFWVGLVPASILFGPLWRVVNPLRSIHAGMAWILRLDPVRGTVALPASVGYWPAACSLAAFGWLELVDSDRAEPRHLACWVISYSLMHTVAALTFGRRWFDQCDGFEVYSTLLASLSLWGKKGSGEFVVRHPLEGLADVRREPGLPAVLIVLLGTTAYDGLSRTTGWQTNIPQSATNGTIGMGFALLLLTVVFLLGTWRIVTTPSLSGQLLSSTEIAPTLVPIVVGYVLAHYFSLLIFDGQQSFILASDPLGDGADYFGTAHNVIDYTVVSVTGIAFVQIFCIVVGHVIAMLAAHDCALRNFPRSAAIRTQIPLAAAMVTLTAGAVLLVCAP